MRCTDGGENPTLVVLGKGSELRQRICGVLVLRVVKRIQHSHPRIGWNGQLGQERPHVLGTLGLEIPQVIIGHGFGVSILTIQEGFGGEKQYDCLLLATSLSSFGVIIRHSVNHFLVEDGSKLILTTIEESMLDAHHPWRSRHDGE